jgi:FkbM family methyltransferase
MYYSQERQDEYLDKNIFKGYCKGVYVDVGAHDGRDLSNSLFFEESRQWSGILVEPKTDVFDKLKINRPNNRLFNCAVDSNVGWGMFINNTGYTEQISGLQKYMHHNHYSRLKNEIETFGGQSDLIKVRTMPLSILFDITGTKHVHYLSVDVEGAEMAVMKSIDFDAVHIDVIDFENNYWDTTLPVINYLKTHRYRVLNYHGLDIMMIHEESIFFDSKFLEPSS